MRLVLPAVASLTVLVGCTQDFNKFLSTGGSNTGSTTTGTTTSTTVTTTGTMTTSSTGMPECMPNDVSKCPPAPNDCEAPTCDANLQCAANADLTAHTKCMSAPGAGVCDGMDKCIGCIDQTDCTTAGDLCPSATHVCTPPGCTNNIKDGTETDTDCGGNACPACDNTKACLVAGDCKSGVCDATMHCKACATDPDCSGTQYCDTTTNGGTCLAKKADGQTCTSGANDQCTNANCVTEGATSLCCNNACAGGCSSCLAVNQAAGGTNGTCAPVIVGQDPKASCATGACVTGNCDGAGACGNQPVNTNCGMPTACVPGTPSTSLHNQDKCNATGTCVAGSNTPCTTDYSCEAAVCNTTCMADTECDGTHHCDKNGGALNGTCETCVSNTNQPATGCTIALPGCDTSTDTCVACAVDADCTGGKKCELNAGGFKFKCEACSQSSGGMPCTGADPACDAGTDTCVPCSPLGAGSTFCMSNTAGHACLSGFVCGCTASTDCTGIAGKTKCPTTGPNSNTCQQCGVDGDCTNDPNGGKCATATSTCGCAAPADCSGTTHNGNTCGAVTAGQCGCTMANQATDCASFTNKVCTAGVCN